MRLVTWQAPLVRAEAQHQVPRCVRMLLQPADQRGDIDPRLPV